jgi:hypothetical protein
VPLPTDRGYVVITDEADGTRTVHICASINDGSPQNVFAQHVRSPVVSIHPDVATVQAGSSTCTTDIAQVYADEEGTVHVASVSQATVA